MKNTASQFAQSSTPILVFCLLFCLVVCLSLSPIAPQKSKKMDRLKQAFRKDRFVAYTPSEYNPLPGQKKPATFESILVDLQTLRPYFNALVTYSCNADDGLDKIVPIAERLGYHVVLGIWDVQSVREIETAVSLARRHPNTVIGIIVGNETLTMRRASWEALGAAIRIVQAALPDVAVSTTEPITEYGDEELRRIVDFHAPNCHWVFQGGNRQDVRAAIEWLKQRIKSLQELPYGNKPILIKEHGLPSAPLPFTPELQAQYWKIWLTEMPNTEMRASVFWEAFDLPWKSQTNPSELSEMEAHWGGWDQQRKPKPVVSILPRLR